MGKVSRFNDRPRKRLAALDVWTPRGRVRSEVVWLDTFLVIEPALSIVAAARREARKRGRESAAARETGGPTEEGPCQGTPVAVPTQNHSHIAMVRYR